jgi:glutamate-1-semialdehyde 2,1-aminomutase
MVKAGVDYAPITDYRSYVTTHDAPRWTHLRRCLLEEGVRAIERGLWSISLAHTDQDIDDALTRAAIAFKRHAETYVVDA